MNKNDELKAVMTAAYQRGYRGTGQLWGYETDEVRGAAIANNEHDQVLRSEEFCSSFWPAARALMPAEVPLSVLEARSLGEELTRWENHHRVLQAHEDPLEYCFEHFS
jgi:hypothetical protein